MRDALAPLEGRRIAVQGVVVRTGTRAVIGSLRRETLLLRQIATHTGSPICDHVWLDLGRRLAALDPRPGDVIAFSGTVRPYRKGRLLRPDGSVRDAGLDYKLTYPAGLRLVARPRTLFDTPEVQP